MKIRFDTTLERDIDLLIIEEFLSSQDFAAIFLEAVGIDEPYEIEELTHSDIDADLGESDIVIILNLNGKKHAIHIEDKINAQAMPQQRERYKLRIEKDIKKGRYDSASYMIVAPAQYLTGNSVAQEYEHHVSYEKMIAYFTELDDLRSQYKTALLQQAVGKKISGYQHVPNDAVAKFCRTMNAYQKKKHPGLPPGSESYWSRRHTAIKGVNTVYKAINGYCDLTFTGMTTEELHKITSGFLSERMVIEGTRKSAFVRIYVPSVSLERRFEDKIAEVDEALDALQELNDLAKKIAVRGSE